MTDRYDEATRALHEVTAPDQWTEIQRRAQAPDETDHVIALDGERAHRRPRLPVLAAAAAVLIAATVGAVTLMNRDSSDPTTDRTDAPTPDTRPPDAPTTTTTEPPTTTTRPDDAGPPPDPADRDDPDETPDDSPGEVPAGYGEPNPMCRSLELALTDPPQGLAPGMSEPAPDDPRVNEGARADLIGVFGGPTTTRAVFVVNRWLGEDGGRTIRHPLFGEIWLAHDGDQGIADLSLTLNEETCYLHVISIGVTEAEHEQILLGLRHAH